VVIQDKKENHLSVLIAYRKLKAILFFSLKFAKKTARFSACFLLFSSTKTF
jgi:hypothetical protein